MGDVEIPTWLKVLPLAPEYHPTETEFSDPIAYISRIEKEASAFGICKIIPPLPKPSKRFVLSNLNRSLSKCPELVGEATSASHVGCGDDANEGEIRAVFTTRQQELGFCPKRLKEAAPSRQLATQKQVWQSGEVYTLDQFESKSKAFARSHLSGVKEVSPLTVESLFWKAASEKPIYVEYANDVPGSGFGEPEEPFQLFQRRKRRRRFDRKYQEKNGCQKSGLDSAPSRNANSSMNKPIPRSPTLHPDEGARLCMQQKDLTNASVSNREGTAGWKMSNSPWNLQVIAQSQGSLTRFMLEDIPGVTSPMVYMGMLFSWFAWHVEDHELHSLNFLHMGAPKTWYAVPGNYAFALEEVIRVQGYGEHLDRLASLTVLGEKTTLLSPQVVVSSGIPCCRLVQHPGEFVVTFPRAYHIGFSHGFNCGEAANFATAEWLKVAKEAAVRRAAMNHLPMLSHQQLLYLLTMSFVSRVPVALLPGVRSSRLKDRQKEEREILVKKAFLDDVMTENQRLVALLRKSTTSHAVLWDPDLLAPAISFPTFPSSSIEPLSLSVGLNECESEKDVSYKETALHAAAAAANFYKKSSSADCHADSFDDKINGVRSYAKTMDSFYGEEDGLPRGLHVDSGTLMCVACGMLGFPFMSVMQPSERALKKILQGGGTNAVSVEIISQVKRDENQVCNSSLQHGQRDSVAEFPEAERNSIQAENSSECHPCAINFLPDLVTEKEKVKSGLQIGAKPINEINNPGHSKVNIQDIPGLSKISVQFPPPIDSGNESHFYNHVANMALQNQMQVDNADESTFLKSNETVTGNRIKSDHISEIEPCKTEGTLQETTSNGHKINNQWNISNAFLRPRIFCLEHALEVEKLLQSQGGANVLVICHSDYLIIKPHIPSTAEDIDVHPNYEDIPLETASQADLALINMAIDVENEKSHGNWTSKLCLNLHQFVNIRKQCPSKKEQYALNLSGLFSDDSHGLNNSTLRWKSRKSRTCRRGNGINRFDLLGSFHEKQNENKMVSHLGVNVSNEIKALQRIDKHAFSRRRSRGCESQRNHNPKLADSGCAALPIEKGNLEDKNTANSSDQPPHGKGELEIYSTQVFNSSNVADSAPKSLEVLETIHQINTVVQSRDSISHALDSAMQVISENQREMRNQNFLPLKVCSNVPHASEEVSTVNETKMAPKDCDISSSSLLAVDTSEVQRPIEACSLLVEEVLNCANSSPLPVKSASKTIIVQPETQIAEKPAMRPAPYDCETSIEGVSANISATDDSEMQSEVYPVTDPSEHLKPYSNPPSTSLSMEATFEIKLENDTRTNDCSRPFENIEMLNLEVLRDMPESVIKDSEMLHERDTVENSNMSRVFGPLSRNVKKTSSNQVLVYSRIRRGQPRQERVSNEKKDVQQSSFNFIRSPCEGLRPRSNRKLARETDASGEFKGMVPEKRVRMTPESFGSRNKPKQKVCYTCDVDGCRMEFLSKVDLQLHKRNRCTHKGCGKGFSSHKYASRHECVHNDFRPLKCPWEGCNMSFKWAWAKTEHMRVHTGERPYQCKVVGCGLTFRFVSDYSRHRRRTGHSVN